MLQGFRFRLGSKGDFPRPGENRLLLGGKRPSDVSFSGPAVAMLTMSALEVGADQMNELHKFGG